MTAVTVNVYLPLLTLSLGYVQVAGLWGESAEAAMLAWQTPAPPATAWQPGGPGAPPDWEREKV